jgi:aspartyl aminopeptidase
LDRDVNDAFKFNKESHLVPILSSVLLEQLGEEEEKKNTSHHSTLLKIISEEIGCKTSSIRDFELSVVDTQPSCFGGAKDEFIFSPRLDNLLSCFTALEGFFGSMDSIESDGDVRMVSFFDHEVLIDSF